MTARKLGEVINLPPVVHPDELKADREYVIILRSTAHEWTFDGPFRPIGEVLPIGPEYPYPGNFRVKAKFRNREEKFTLIPKDGHTRIMKHEWSLHLYTPEIKKIMERTSQLKRNWMRGSGGHDH